MTLAPSATSRRHDSFEAMSYAQAKYRSAAAQIRRRRIDTLLASRRVSKSHEHILHVRLSAEGDRSHAGNVPLLEMIRYSKSDFLPRDEVSWPAERRFRLVEQSSSNTWPRARRILRLIGIFYDIRIAGTVAGDITTGTLPEFSRMVKFHEALIR